MDFKLHAPFNPMGDQPEAIKQLTEGLNSGDVAQTLLGATGTGKTFTVANVIREVNRPTLILSHNKTLAAQLFTEFKQFFPENLVEYFVSYYDYYQPEAYLPVTGTYIEKDLSINEEIDKFRLRTTSSLLSGRRDVIVVASVSCIYGIGNPNEFHKSVIQIQKGQMLSRNKFLLQLVEGLYARTEHELERGKFRVKGDTVDIYLAYADYGVRILFWGDEVESIESIDPVSGKRITAFDSINIYPANIFVTSKDTLNMSIDEIQTDMAKQVDFFREIGKPLEAKRLQERVEYDVEMMKELGYCSGIENYSRYFDRRQPGERPFCIIDYFPDDYLMVIDESHVTIPQIRGMYGGDFSRKKNLVDYGFRLPAAMDNRPLKFEEFQSLINQVIYVSATPAEFELEASEGVLVDQVIRPTGVLDPVIEIRPTQNQIDDLMDEIRTRAKKSERVLVTTLTKRMAEELNTYLTRMGIRCTYIHSDIETLDRIEILRQLRLGSIDVLIGVNLLREGLDLPEVSLVAILDADKEGFLRSTRSLTQTAGRAARNINGRVIMYADKITDSMQRTMDETERRREKQLHYNEIHGIVPRAITKSTDDHMGQSSRDDGETNKSGRKNVYFPENEGVNVAADPIMQYMGPEEMKKAIAATRKKMDEAAGNQDFLVAAQLRDELFAMEELLKNKSDEA